MADFEKNKITKIKITTSLPLTTKPLIFRDLLLLLN